MRGRRSQRITNFELRETTACSIRRRCRCRRRRSTSSSRNRCSCSRNGCSWRCALAGLMLRNTEQQEEGKTHMQPFPRQRRHEAKCCVCLCLAAHSKYCLCTYNNTNSRSKSSNSKNQSQASIVFYSNTCVSTGADTPRLPHA